MKKLFLILTVVVLLVIAALAVFVATFDINKYKKPIVAQIEAAVGNPVEIGRLSLKWKGRFLLSVDKFQIFAEEKGRRVSVLSFDRADVALEFLPLLSRRISVPSISVDGPVINVIRSKEGKIEVRGYAPKPQVAAPVKPSGASSAASPVADLSVRSIIIRGGTIRFVDLSGAPTYIVIKKIDADIKNVSLTEPIKFMVKAAVFSEEQNVETSGVAGGFTKSPMFVKDMNIAADLGAIDFSVLSDSVPAVQKMGLKKGPEGSFKIKVRTLEFADNKMTALSADVDLDKGKLFLSGINAPLENIDMSVSAEKDIVTIRSFSAKLATAALKISGNVKNIFTVPDTTLQMTADIAGVKAFVSSVYGGKQFIDGNIDFSFDGKMSGASWEIISKTLTGSGTLALDNGVLVDTNLLKQSLGALEMFPGILEKVNSFLPASLKESMGKPSTLLKPVRQSFTVKDKVVALPALKLETDFASVDGAADLTLQGAVSGKGMIRFSKELSGALTKAVPEIDALQDNEEKIMFPVAFKASAGGVLVIPDLKYIAEKTVMKKGQKIVSDLLKNAAETKKTEGAAQTGSEAEKSSGFGDIMKKIKTLSQTSQTSEQGASAGTTQ